MSEAAAEGTWISGRRDCGAAGASDVGSVVTKVGDKAHSVGVSEAAEQTRQQDEPGSWNRGSGTVADAVH